jgi:uncharacterized protein (TIGR02118 family)
MVRVTILYPNKKGARFDMRYYTEKHIPMSIKWFSEHSGYKGVAVDKGLIGMTPGSEPPYVAICHFLFNSAEDFFAAFMPHAAELQGDVPKYTDIEPVIQFNEVVLSR